jgi:hypothetical protein
MNDTAREFERLLGHAALKLWPDLPRDVQELLFGAAVPTDPIRLSRLSWHNGHPNLRTEDGADGAFDGVVVELGRRLG